MSYEGYCEDCGCMATKGDFETNIYCYIPLFIRKIKANHCIKQQRKAEEEYWKRYVKVYEDDIFKDFGAGW